MTQQILDYLCTRGIFCRHVSTGLYVLCCLIQRQQNKKQRNKSGISNTGYFQY